MNLYTSLLGSIFFACPFLSHAQDRPASLSDTTGALQEVVVTASRKPTSSEMSPFSVSVLGEKQIREFMYRSSPEALMGVPGVFVQKTNHGGGSAFVRGLTGNQTLLLIDGIRLNNATFRYGPNQYLNTVDRFTVHKIEVVKGSGSVQYGSDAMGGVIHVLTHDPKYAEQATVTGKVVGRNWSEGVERTGRAQAAYASRKLALTGGFSLKKFGDLIGGDTTGRQAPSGYREADADVKLKWKMADNLEITAAHQFVKQDEVPVYHKVKLENFAINAMGLQRRNLSYLKMNHTNESAWFRSVMLTGSFQETAEVRHSQKNGSSTFRSERDDIGTSNASVEVLSVFSSYWSANSGTEYYFDKIGSFKEDKNAGNNTSVRGRGLYPDKSSYSNASIYSLHHLHFHNWNLEAGLRYNWFTASITDAKLGNVKITPSATVFNVGARYGFGNHNLYASISTGYRAPNIDDMGTLGIVDFRYELPAYGLKPEKSNNTEIGYRLSTHQWRGSLAFFHNRLHNLITRVKSEGELFEGYHVYRKENVESAYIQGGEAFLQWLPYPNLVLSNFLAYTYGKNTSKNEPLRRTPPLNGNVSVRFNHKRYYLSTELGWAARQTRLAQGDKDDNRILKGGTPGWQVLNLYAGYQYNMLQFRLSGQNLLNADYRTHGSGINGVGRSASLELQLSF